MIQQNLKNPKRIHNIIIKENIDLKENDCKIIE